MEKRNRYAIRKLSVGVASILTGTTFALHSDIVHADEASNPSETTSEVVSTPTETEGDASAETSTNTEENNDPVEQPIADTENNGPSEDQSGNPSPVEDVNRYPLAPVEATKGQIPDAKSAIPNWNNYSNGLSTDNADGFKVEWETLPDTSKLGNTTGKIKITTIESDFDDVANMPIQKTNTKTVEVPITVYDKDSDYIVNDGMIDNSGEPSDTIVKNTIKLVDATNNKIIRTDVIEGYANSYAEVTGFDQIIQCLGYRRSYKEEYQNGSDASDAGTFTDTDQYFTIYLEPKEFYNEEGKTIDPTTTPVLGQSMYADIYLDYSKPVDPAWFIDNINLLPEGTKVEWSEAPKFEVSTDDSETKELVNNPSIKVTLPNASTFTFGGSEDSPLNYMIIYPQSEFDPTIDGAIKVVQGQNLSAQDALTYLGGDNTSNEKPKWNIKPDTTKAGYTWAKLDLQDITSTKPLVLIRVEPRQTETGDSLTSEELPQMNYGTSGEELTQDELPKLDIGVSGDPLVDEKPALEIPDNPTDPEPTPAQPEASKSDPSAKLNVAKKQNKRTKGVEVQRKVTRANVEKPVKTNVKFPNAAADEVKLPETGENQTSKVSILAIATLLLSLALFGLTKRKKK